MTTTVSPPACVLAEAEVVSVSRLSPSFARVELSAPQIADLGTDGPWYDQRIKLIFDAAPHAVPRLTTAGNDWFGAWCGLPETDRGSMRTYSVRDLRGNGADTRLVVDFIVHEGECGPGGTFGATAQVGDRVVVVGPRRGVEWGGIEFEPGAARRLLVVGDETAVPAVAAILEQLPRDAVGAVFLEVPVSGDVLALRHPDRVELRWLPRDGEPRGAGLHAAVLDHLGEPGAATAVADEEVDVDLWETPEHSSSGESVAASTSIGHDWDGLYAWIAGEAKVVTGLRRALVRELGIDRSQVAFMGYWRQGVAMKG